MLAGHNARQRTKIRLWQYTKLGMSQGENYNALFAGLSVEIYLNLSREKRQCSNSRGLPRIAMVNYLSLWEEGGSSQENKK